MPPAKVIVIMSNHRHRNISVVTLVTRKVTTNVRLKPLWAAIAGIATLSLPTTIQPAHAFSVTYAFTVQINSDAYETQGLNQGAIEQGSFTYDNDGLKPYLTYDDNGLVVERGKYASPLQGNLTLAFNFLNNIYTEKADLNYGSQLYSLDYPAALFSNGQLVGLDFLVVPSRLQPPQNAIGFRIFKDTFYFGATDNSSKGSGVPIGTVTYSNIAVLPELPSPSSGVAAVPEPSDFGGAIVACSLLGVWAMKKVKRQKN